VNIGGTHHSAVTSDIQALLMQNIGKPMPLPRAMKTLKLSR